MTTTLEAPKQKGAKSKGGLLAPPHPQVNLLPPEVHAKRGLVRVKRMLVIVVVFSLVVAAGLVALSMMAQKSAEAELTVQQTETERLQIEQQKYAEVPLVLGQLQTAEEARALAMQTEVAWPTYLSAMAAVLPPGVSIENFTVASIAPAELAPLPANPLHDSSVATVELTVNSLTIPDTTVWLDGLETVPGFADAWFSTATVTAKEDFVYYTVTATVQLNEQAFTNRFALAEEEL